MFFKSAELENFRNYKKQRVEFDRKLNLFLGANAQGKTNLLESLFIMSFGRSFRTCSDRNMIAFGEERARVRCVISEDDESAESEIEIVLGPEGKLIKVGGVKLQRSSDLLERICTVVFSPDDLRIVKDGPENRRRFLDRELCQIKPVYYSDLGNYKKVLRQRNMLLRERSGDEDLIDVFDEALSDYGLRITDERRAFVARLGEISKEIHFGISHGKEELLIGYESGVSEICGEANAAAEGSRSMNTAAEGSRLENTAAAGSRSENAAAEGSRSENAAAAGSRLENAAAAGSRSENAAAAGSNSEDRKRKYKERLKKNFEDDLRKGHTGFGPHKDDLSIFVNGTDIRQFGSQGQQRSAALSMKLAEIALIKQETGKNAVLLLDDVLSELDAERQKYLAEAVKGIQVFISSASPGIEALDLLPEGRRFEICGGAVKMLT